MAKDFLIDNDGNYIIKNGDFVVGDSDLQEVAEVIEMHPGECKEDPIIGAALTRLVKSNYDAGRVRSELKKHLGRDGKDYEQYKEFIELNR